MTLVYFPPAKPARRAAPPPPIKTVPPEQRDTRPPSTETRDPGTAPGDAAVSSQTESAPAQAAPAPSTEAAATPQRPRATDQPREALAAATPTLEAETERLFGPKPPPMPAGGPRLQSLIQAGPAGDARFASNCRLEPLPGDTTAGATGMVTIAGRIFRRGTRLPLSGAHLQMIGTPYSAFADADGRYLFRFDVSLVADCRTQLVRVEAPGYATQWLSVVVSPQIHSNDIELERHRF